MKNIIRNMKKGDRLGVIEMMKVFYASDAVLTNGSEEIFNNDFEACVGESPYLEGYIFENEEDVTGYAMVAKSFSTEAGRHLIWIEDIYIKKAYRGLKIGSEFLSFIENKYRGYLIRLEAEAENEDAVRVYKKNGYEILPYLEMKKEV